jgi:hypothetical protein
MIMQDHLLCLVWLRPSLALLNGIPVTEEDLSEAQRWAEDRAAAATAAQPYTGFRDHAKEARKPGEQRPSLTPSSITFDDIWLGELLHHFAVEALVDDE